MRADDILPAGEGQRYASAADLGNARDLAEMDVRVRRWRGPDGAPLVLRVRALDLTEQAEVNKLAGVGEAREWTPFYLETIRRGVVMPHLSDADVRGLAHKNPSVVHALASYIWDLADLDQRDIDAAVAELTRDLPGA